MFALCQIDAKIRADRLERAWCTIKFDAKKQEMFCNTRRHAVGPRTRREDVASRERIRARVRFLRSRDLSAINRDRDQSRRRTRARYISSSRYALESWRLALLLSIAILVRVEGEGEGEIFAR